ncbi:integrase core domain-containing protein [Bordetella trematum]|uniref:integrase core domain-containing protein n=1 Tax=Bordetella trematum TaxID=123899 RepID=UPI0013FE2EE0
MDDAKEKIDAWRTYYNEVRPHSALKWQAPAEYARQHLADGQIANLNEPEISTSDPD